MGEVVVVPEFCPGGHKRNPGEVRLSVTQLPGLTMWGLLLEYGCDECEIKIFSQMLTEPPSEVRDTGGNVLRIIT